MSNAIESGMKNRTLFQAAIARVLDCTRSHIGRDECKRLYREYTRAHRDGRTEDFEVARMALWTLLIDAGALQGAWADKR